MTLLTDWIQSASARALGWTLFHFLWEGIAIAAVLAVFLLLVRDARLRYAAACLAFAAMLAACSGTFLLMRAEQTGAHTATLPLSLPQAPDADRSPEKAAPRFHAADLLPWAAPLWLMGVLLLHVRTVVSWTAARRLRRSGVCAASPAWQQRMAALAADLRLSTPVMLLESCHIDVPLMVGYLRPTILLPLGLLAGMPAEHLEAILLHELAHIRRRDYLVNLLQTLAENLLFYHPAVWWISTVIRTEREHCCDDLVVAMRGDARGYAIALTALEQRRWAGEPALAATGGNLMKRITRLLEKPQPAHAALTPAFSASLIIVIAATALAAWQPKPQDQPQDPSSRAVASPYRKWLNEDVAYIISDPERITFRQLTTDEERERFIEQFWLRRDPTPGTPENEFKQEHYRRIAYANQRYATASGLAGWKTDRGRVYIAYGPPDEIESHPSGDRNTPYPYEEWLYRLIAGVGENVIIRFNDSNSSGEYRMAADPHAASLTAPPIAAAMDPTVRRDAVWIDVVRRGDMRLQVRGLGILGEDGTAVVKVAVPQVQYLHLGQTASVDLKSEVVSGRLARIDPPADHRTATVTIQLDAPPPAASQKGQTVDSVIDIEILSDVIYVGRPVFGQPGSAVLFKMEADGRHAVRVPVHFGKNSVNQIEILSGLVPGDRVILSDMSAYVRFDRIELR